MRPAEGAWAAAAVSDTADSLLFFVPKLLEDATLAPVLALNLSSGPPSQQKKHALAVGATALAYGPDSTLWVAMPTCIILITTLASTPPRTVAGECLSSEGGSSTPRRDGPPLFARFQGLSALAVAPTSPRFFAAVDGDARLLVLGTPWQVASVPGYISLAPIVQVSVLVAPDRVLLLVVLQDRPSALFQCVGCVRSAADGAWSQLDAPFLPAVIRSGLLLPQATGGVWCWFLAADGGLLRARIDDAATASLVARTPSNSSSSYDHLAPGGSSSEIAIWAIDLQNERLLPVPLLLLADDSSSSGDTSNNSSSNCTASCHLGEALLPLAGLCVRSPPGGYVVASDLSFVPCPAGTYNPDAGAVHPDACRPCPPFTSNPLEGAARCAACPAFAPLQAPSRTRCLAMCPPSAIQTEEDGACLPCPLPGYYYYDAACTPCPAMTATLKGPGWPCEPCPAGTVADAGASACTPTSSPGAACVPQAGWSYALPADTYEAYTLVPTPSGDCTQLAAARNGTLWLVCAALGLLRLTPVPQGAAVAPPSHLQDILWPAKGDDDGGRIQALALPLNEASLFVAARNGSIIIVAHNNNNNNNNNELVAIAPRPYASIACLCLAAPAPTALERLLAPGGDRLQWLFWLTLSPPLLLSARPGSPTVAVVSEDPGLQLIAPDTPDGRGGLLVVLADADTGARTLYHFDPLGGVFTPLGVEIAPEATWLSAIAPGLLAFDRIHAIAIVVVTTDSTTPPLLVGDAAVPGHVDGATTARLILPTAPFVLPPASSSSSADDPLLLFLEPATAFVRAIIRRGCECAEDHRRAGANLCLPCAAGLHAEAGDAAGCSVCPAGEYLDPLGLCTACPLRLWWRDPHLPCARLRSTYPYLTGTLFLYTLAEAQALVVNDATLLNQQHCWAVQSTAWSLFHVAADDPPEDVPDASWLLRADLLGPFWRAWYDPPPSPLLPDVYDPDGVAAWGSPPLLAQCASPDAPCACRLPASAPPPLLLGEPGPPWNAARQRAPPGLLFFMLDPNPGGGGPWPISSSQGGEEWAVTDGTCVGPIAMGWPAVRRCVSPVHRWAYPTPATPGGACLPCASGTFAPSDYDTACAPPTDTLGGPAQCPPGMFLQLYPRTTPDVIVTRACLPCPAGTYAPGPMVGACRPKAVLACPPGAFLFDDGLAQADNECRPCVPCPPGKVPLPADAPCAGGATRYQAYLCLPDGLHALPGYALRFVPPPTSILLPDARRLATVAYVPCGARPPAAAVWATGPPYAGVCYFRCMYALPTDGGAAYYAAVRPFLPASILVDGGRIVPAALGDAAALLLLPSFPNASATAAFWATGLPDRVCPPCVPTACPIGTFRVHGSDPCPPCMLAPELCTTTAPSSVPQHAMGRRLLQQPQEEPSSFDTTTETTTDGGGSTSTDTASWSTETPTAASTTSSFDEISSSSDEATTTTDIATTPDDTLTTANETTTAAATDTTATLDTYDNMTTTAAAATTATPPPQTEEGENATTTTTMLTGEGFTTPADTTPLTIANNINNNNSSTSSSGGGSSTLILPTGCVPLCDAVVPSNAHAIRADCAWRCDDGWFLARDGGACLPCDAASACAPGQRFLPNACVPTAKAVCADCPPQDLATLVVPVQGTFCRYACLANLSYPNPDPFDSRPCLPCTANTTTTTSEDNQPLLCAPGMYLDASACPPECLPCPTPFDTLGGTALLAPTADAICRVQCRPGFHTLVDGEVLLLVDGGQDPARTACEPCAQRPRLPCGTCPAGTAAPAPCTPCLDAVALGCPPGTYAPPCPGGAVLQPLLGCLRCPPSLILAAPEDNVPGRWPTRFFLPPGAVPPPDAAYIIPTTTETDCLTACVPDAMLVQLGGGRRLCRGCDTLPVPYGAPYRSYAARWNATPGRRWWPAGFDPLHLPPRAHRAISPIEPRAGLCWPCPLLSPSDTHVNNNDDDLCIRPAVNNNNDDETVAFVVVADDDNTTTTTIDNRLLAIRYDDEPSIAHARDGPTVLANRRLLQDVDDACAPGTYASAAYTSVRRRLRWCTPCPSGAACPPGATAPVPCPPAVPARLLRAGQSACPSPQTPSDLAEGGSGCPPGYAILHDPPWSPPRCEPCPPGAFGTDGAVCHACPPAHTAEAAGATACTPLPPTPALTCETTLYERVSVTSFPPVCACAPGAFFRRSSHIIIQRTRFDDNNDGGNNNDKNKRNGTATTAAIIADNNDDGGECWPCPPNTHSPFVGNAPCISIDNNNNHP